MCDLGGWDAAIMISTQSLRDLVIALDQSVQPTIDTYPAATLPGNLQMNLPELLLNQELMVPRVLYASINPDFDPGPARYPGADDDLEQLHARLQEYVRLNTIDLATQQILGDPGRRLSFVRDRWYDGVTAFPDIGLHPLDWADNSVRLGLSGKVLVGDNFVEGAAVINSPESLDFTMELEYRVRIRQNGSFFPLDQLNIGLGSLPFTTLDSSCDTPINRRLPPGPGHPIWAQNLNIPTADNAGLRWQLSTANNITAGNATLFTGAPSDVIVDPDNPDVERWRVMDQSREPESPLDPPDSADGLISLPRRVLWDIPCGQAVGESGKTFAVFEFSGIHSLQIVGRPLAPEEMEAVRQSIMKVDGFLLGAWFNLAVANPAGAPSLTMPRLALIAMLGKQAMDFGPLPANLTLPLVPREVTGDGPPYVTSDALTFQDAATHVFDESTGDAIALGGKFSDLELPAGALPEAFHQGQDLAIAIGQNVVDRWMLPQVRPALRAALVQSVPGFDGGAFDNCPNCLRLQLASGRLEAHISGAGSIDIAFLELPFEFTIDFPLRLITRPALLRDGCGRPLDVLGNLLPVDLSCLGLKVIEGNIADCNTLDLADPDFLATNPGTNPLCFLGYVDPRAGGDPALLLPTGPWTLVNGGGCGAGTTSTPTVPAAFRWQERDFPVPPFPCPGGMCTGSLRPGLEVTTLPPRRDELDVDPDFPWWVDLAVGLVAGPFLGIGPISGPLITGVLANLLAEELAFPGLQSGVANLVPLQLNSTTGWQLFLQHSNPVVGPSNDALTIDNDTICLLFRALPTPDVRLGNWAAAVAGSFGL